MVLDQHKVELVRANRMDAIGRKIVGNNGILCNSCTLCLSQTKYEEGGKIILLLIAMNSSHLTLNFQEINPPLVAAKHFLVNELQEFGVRAQ